MSHPVTFRFRVKVLPKGVRLTKIIIGMASIFTVISMLLFAVVSLYVLNDSFRKYHNTNTALSQSENNTVASTNRLQQDVDGAIELPVVNLSVDKQLANTGETVQLSWDTTKATDCVATDDWMGQKALNGSETSQKFTKPGDYIFTITCTTRSGTAFAALAVTVTNPGTTPPAYSAVVTAQNTTTTKKTAAKTSTSKTTTSSSSSSSSSTSSKIPTTSIATGSSSVNNSKNSTSVTSTSTAATSSGTTKPPTTTPSGSSTNTPSTTTSSPTTSTSTTTIPQVTLTTSPGSVTKGASALLSWTTKNNPTSCTASDAWSGAKSVGGGSQNTGVLSAVGTKSYKLTCTNSAGSNSSTATVTVTEQAPVIVKPTVTIQVSPSSFTAGGATTVTWSTTNSPTSCTASGAWSGSKATSGGSQSVTIATAGTHTVTLNCSNTAGTAASSASIEVLQPKIYCSGKEPCYRTADLTSRQYGCLVYDSSVKPYRLLNITKYATIGKHTSQDLANTGYVCGHDIAGYLNGSAAIPGFSLKGYTKFSHKQTTIDLSGISQFIIGYYDPEK